jgi:hypothetical protein
MTLRVRGIAGSFLFLSISPQLREAVFLLKPAKEVREALEQRYKTSFADRAATFHRLLTKARKRSNKKRDLIQTRRVVRPRTTATRLPSNYPCHALTCWTVAGHALRHAPSRAPEPGQQEQGAASELPTVAGVSMRMVVILQATLESTSDNGCVYEYSPQSKAVHESKAKVPPDRPYMPSSGSERLPGNDPVVSTSSSLSRLHLVAAINVLSAFDTDR